MLVNQNRISEVHLRPCTIADRGLRWLAASDPRQAKRTELNINTVQGLHLKSPALYVPGATMHFSSRADEQLLSYFFSSLLLFLCMRAYITMPRAICDLLRVCNPLPLYSLVAISALSLSYSFAISFLSCHVFLVIIYLLV